MSKLAISQVDEQHLRVTGELTHNSIGNERLLNTKRETKHKTLYFDLTEVTRVDTVR